jgi:hypothetical protein
LGSEASLVAVDSDLIANFFHGTDLLAQDDLSA